MYISAIMKKILIFVFFTILWFGNSLAEIVNKIEIKGNDRVSKTTIINFSKINKGDDINSDTLNKSLKSLYETNFFEDVNIDFQNYILFINV